MQLLLVNILTALSYCFLKYSLIYHTLYSLFSIFSMAWSPQLIVARLAASRPINSSLCSLRNSWGWLAASLRTVGCSRPDTHLVIILVSINTRYRYRKMKRCRCCWETNSPKFVFFFHFGNNYCSQSKIVVHLLTYSPPGNFAGNASSRFLVTVWLSRDKTCRKALHRSCTWRPSY